MVNYNKIIIYKLCCRNPEITDIYVGHTCNHTRRKCEHKKCCLNPNDKDYNCHVYKFIRDNGGFQNWDMIMIEEYPCENKLEAERRERYWIETLNSTLNKVIPTRTKKEYREQNKKYITEKNKKYREKNKEKLNQKINCECGCDISYKSMSRHKRSNKHLELMKLKET